MAQNGVQGHGNHDDLAKNEFVQDAIRDDRANVLRELPETKFGKLPKWVDGRLEAAPSVQVMRWSKKILTAETLEGALGKK